MENRPDAIPAIIASLRASVHPDANPMQLPRTLLVLLQVIKELYTARLQRIRASLVSITPEIFHVLASIYVEKTDIWSILVERGGSSQEEVLATVGNMELSLLCMKVLRRVLISGFDHPNRSEEVREFWLLMFGHVTRYHILVDRIDKSMPESIKLIGKHILQLSKLHVDMARTHPASFALLPDSIPLVKAYWMVVVKLGDSFDSLDATGDPPGNTLIEKSGLRALLLLRACAKMAFNPVQTFKYQTLQDKEEKKQAVELVKSELFSHEFVVSVMELLVTKFFRFRKNDFQEWEEDPEGWEKQEEEISDAWEFSIRSCSEKLFLDLVIHFKDLLIPRLLNVFYSFASEFHFFLSCLSFLP